MNVLIVMPLAEQRGGGEMMLWDLMRQGRGQGINWRVVFFSDGPLVREFEKMGIPTVIVPSGRLREPLRVLGAVAAIAAEAKRMKADVILSWMTKAHLYAYFAGLMTRVPTLWFQLGFANRSHKIDRAASFLPARGILTLSKANEAAQRKVTPHTPTRMVYPGVELDRFDLAALPSPDEARAEVGLPPTGPVIGLVGRMQRWKGVHVLIEAMPAVLKQCPDAHCVVIGGDHPSEPTYSAQIEERIQALGIAGHVTMAGIQSNVPAWMQAMDVCVHASDREPFGIVIIEAMALGKPVVATDTDGPSEIITDGKDGLLTPYGDADALSGAILRYLTNPQEARMVGQAAARRAREFSTARYAQNVIRAVQELAAPPERGVRTRVSARVTGDASEAAHE